MAAAAMSLPPKVSVAAADTSTVGTTDRHSLVRVRDSVPDSGTVPVTVVFAFLYFHGSQLTVTGMVCIILTSSTRPTEHRPL